MLGFNLEFGSSLHPWLLLNFIQSNRKRENDSHRSYDRWLVVRWHALLLWSFKPEPQSQSSCGYSFIKKLWKVRSPGVRIQAEKILRMWSASKRQKEIHFWIFPRELRYYNLLSQKIKDFQRFFFLPVRNKNKKLFVVIFPGRNKWIPLSYFKRK